MTRISQWLGVIVATAFGTAGCGSSCNGIACVSGAYLHTTVPDSGAGGYEVTACRAQSCHTVVVHFPEESIASTEGDGWTLTVTLVAEVDVEPLSLGVQLRDMATFPDGEAITFTATAPDGTIQKEASAVADYETTVLECGSCTSFVEEV